MNELPEDILRIMTQYLPRVVTCLYFELAMGKKINSKEYYVSDEQNQNIRYKVIFKCSNLLCHIMTNKVYVYNTMLL